tara:strand:+ start:219 stop:596 length:378 start_codon:yes stop_codon:yes gene_type:complete
MSFALILTSLAVFVFFLALYLYYKCEEMKQLAGVDKSELKKYIEDLEEKIEGFTGIEKSLSYAKESSDACEERESDLTLYTEWVERKLTELSQDEGVDWKMVYACTEGKLRGGEHASVCDKHQKI